MDGKYGLRLTTHRNKQVWSLFAMQDIAGGKQELPRTNGSSFTSDEPGRRSIRFIDEQYSGEIHDTGVYVDKVWFEGNIHGGVT